jgi:Uri superfamily endonuclease
VKSNPKLKHWGIEHLINQFIMVITLILLREDCKKEMIDYLTYQYFIDNFSTQPWSRTIDFKRKNKKSKE